jgi:hypothetical protein
MENIAGVLVQDPSGFSHAIVFFVGKVGLDQGGVDPGVWLLELDLQLSVFCVGSAGGVFIGLVCTR